MYSMGCLRSIPDFRNYKFATIKNVGLSVNLPKEVDLRPFCTAIFEQDGIGSCVACALTALKEFVDKKDDGVYDTLSVRFVYYLIRNMMGTVDRDSGGYINYGTKVLANHGACLESEMPYDNAYYNYKEMPTGRMLFSGLHRRISSYWELLGLNDMKTCLAGGYPFVGGVSVYDSFVSEDTAKTGDIPMPKDYESRKGGHAICFVGYNDSTQRYIFKNSWGTHWGNEGYGTIPYGYVESMGWDFWTIRK